MLHRTSSSRRRRASRSAATSPQARAPRSGSQPPVGRRASLAAPDDAFHDEPPPAPRSPRHSLAPEPPSYGRTNFMPDPYYNRSPRHSLVPETASRSARNLIMPDAALSPRNSLAPAAERTSRNSLVPDAAYGSRLSLNPQDFNRSPRNSITPDTSARSPRRSLVPEGAAWSQPRNSLVPEMSRSPRHSVASIQLDPARAQRAMEATSSARTSPRGSVGPESGRLKESEHNRSPRGSIAPESCQRSPRGSIAQVEARGARGSLVPAECADPQRISPRGSLTLTFQEPIIARERRASEASDSGARRSVSPYRGAGGARPSGAAGGWAEGGSRRASSSVSQMSGDEQRRLCSEQAGCASSCEARGGLSLGLTTYGSVAYQLKDANLEASGTCDFLLRAVRILNRTVLMTAIIACLSSLPVIMLIIGVQYLRDCPQEPHLPVYMVVGGSAGGVKMAWLLWRQLGARSPAPGGGASPAARLASGLLTVFLLAWFALGNYWTLRIRWPAYQPTLFEPNAWCHRTLYVFALVHLVVLYGTGALLLSLVLALAACQMAGCAWLGPTRFK